MTERRKYTPQFKADAVELVVNSGRSIVQCSTDRGPGGVRYRADGRFHQRIQACCDRDHRLRTDCCCDDGADVVGAVGSK